MAMDAPKLGPMSKKEKISSKVLTATKVLRESSSGKFKVAPAAKPPKRFTSTQIRDAVRKVNAAKA